MSWRDNLHLDGKGSFREVQFFVRRAQSSVGRRVIIHKYPGRDDIGTQDNGREPREFRLEAFVLGDNYMYERDQLRKAFEKAGPGPLVHPYWGTATVVVRSKIQISETWDEGGMARFVLDVVEVGETLSPVVAPDTAQEVEIKADAVNEGLADAFEENFDVVGFVAGVVQDAIDLINDVVAVLNKIKGYVNSVMAIADAVGDAIEAVADTVTSLVLLPGQLVAQLESIINGITQAIANIGDAWDSYFSAEETPGSIAGDPSTAASGGTPSSSDARVDLTMRSFREMFEFGDDLDTIEENTNQSEQKATNQTAFVDMIRTLAVTETCRAIADMPFSSSNKADSVLDEIAESIDTLLETADDFVFGPLMDLRAAIAKHLQTVSADLPSISTYTPLEAMPALLVAQIIYGDASYDAEIIARNNVRNPCLLPAGDILEVIGA